MHSFTIAGLVIRRTIGHPKGFIMFVILPAIVLSSIVVLFGSSQNDAKTIAVLNEDKGKLGAAIVAAAMEEASVLAMENLYTLRQSAESGSANAAVYVPGDFTSSLLSGGNPRVKLYRLNSTLWNEGLEQKLAAETEKLTQLAAAAYAGGQDRKSREALLERLLAESGSHQLTLEQGQPDGGRSGRKPANVLVTGVMLLFVMIGINQSVQVVMEDRERGTMSRIFASPVRAYEIALGNFMGSLLAGSAQLVLVLGATRGLLHYDYGLGFFSHLLIMECFLLASVGIATAVAGLVRNIEQLSNINNLVVTPTCMLGGCFWPIGIMPDFMQRLANFMPQKWAMEAIDRIAFGSTLQDVLLPLGILLLFAAVLLAFGAFVLQPSR